MAIEIENERAVNTKSYQEALDLAEANKHQEALECIQKHLAVSPNDPEILNDTGAILYCLNRSDEAIEHFLKAKELQPDSAEIIWNLSETYLATENAHEAMKLFDDMERIGILNCEVLNRTAEKLIDNGNLSEASTVLNKSLQLLPNQPLLDPILEVLRSKIAKNKI
ncbi:MAG: hypothetical protein A2Y10_16105 [Planctomycetes bacterium GWF2_41_51]|nr:MAG: hypothetical protein A2Y10_16105 [Planctomycetes bacterium GWF2_41_51]HBG26606.1 hypothetical protein [Phycisphaerales bacterium]